MQDRTSPLTPAFPNGRAIPDDSLTAVEVMSVLSANGKALVIAPLLAGVLALGIAWTLPPVYTAKTVFLPPQQPQQSAAASALASLGVLSGMGATKTTGDQYVSLMQSVNVTDRIIERFGLMKEYDAKYLSVARRQLSGDVQITLGKKDGLITVQVDSKSPETASQMANQYVEELRRLTGELALTEAKQRRVFYEAELERVKARLTAAQVALQRAGFTAGALRAEPKAAAESYARIQAEVVSSEVRLKTLRRTLADGAPEIQQQEAALAALRSQLARMEQSQSEQAQGGDYVGTYREYKYQEALFDIFAKQYEMARLDESKESSIIQVIDRATPPDYKSKPQRGLIAVGATLGTFVLMVFGLLGRHVYRKSKLTPRSA